MDWKKGVQTSSDDNYYKYESVVRFTDKDETSELVTKISTNTIIDFIPQSYYIETQNYDYFMIYCIETKEYNIVESESKLNYIYIAYNIYDKVLIIKEFSKK